ncbi:hypothetical protein CDO52_12790 [Nocardiopsis gilva YIM 90087]|uniref:Uncharacterized protein n=1 Tax=Nocardiopsis gilva YIM 90087 TaxID=1235441 RepID=A0A223S602_9ACTN|nr:hypothetical protein [Nocardiopsis gilva]ASU83546.1 hypothetical protein CDO52_12790 [Nocardiopsis gilva YIM 90087]
MTLTDDIRTLLTTGTDANGALTHNAEWATDACPCDLVRLGLANHVPVFEPVRLNDGGLAALTEIEPSHPAVNDGLPKHLTVWHDDDLGHVWICFDTATHPQTADHGYATHDAAVDAARAHLHAAHPEES